VNAYGEPVAALEDVLLGKAWAYSDPVRRSSKRQKNLANILRLVESYPHLLSELPDPIKGRVEAEIGTTDWAQGEG
jgi:hypothetical protein